MTPMIRDVAQTITPQFVIEGAGVRLKRSIATATLDYVDPFLLFDHFGSPNPRDYLAGFPMHPHRGIETVTYMLAGEVTHRDSLGNSGTIGAGDVQWMTSGRGIMHEEMPKPVQGIMGGFQLWVNLPAKLKMGAPRYQEIRSPLVPEVRRADGSVIRVIAGQVDGVRGPVTEIAADPEYLDVTVAAHAVFEQPVPRGHTALAYVFEGGGVFGGSDAKAGEMVGATRMAILGDGDVVRVQTDNTHGALLAHFGQAAGRADCPLRPIRHEHARRNQSGVA